MDQFDLLKRVIWISGTPCGGKTSVAAALAGQYGWNIYHIDEHFEDHRQRANIEQHRKFYEISRLSGDALWLRPLSEQIESEQQFFDDEFPLICEDLVAHLNSDGRPLVYEGFVSPHLLRAIGCRASSVFYLIPTEEFQRTKYAQRESIRATLSRTSNPELAWSNWMSRDAALARALQAQVDELGFKWLMVDGTISLQQTIAKVDAHVLEEAG